MIKSGEYIQLLWFFKNPNNCDFINRYAAHNAIEVIEACKRFDELRILHNKYKSECENWDVYPHMDLNKMNLLKQDIVRLCVEFKIQYNLVLPKTELWKNGIHFQYFYMNYNITDLIVMYQKRKPSSVSH